MSSSVLMFDTLQYAKKLQKAGMSEQQAEIHAETIKEQNEAISNFIADNLENKLKEFATKKDLEIKLKDLEIKLTIRIGYMLGVAVAFLSMLMTSLKLFGH
ncbi:conserved hypothetical protein [Gammaproteobacteria bacterium]